MNRLPRAHAALLVAALVAAFSAPGAALAQYIYLDANGDGAHGVADVLAPTGPTTFDVWIVTNADRDGSPVTCTADPSQSVTMFSYGFALRAANGTVTYGTATNQRPEFGTFGGSGSDATEFYVSYGGTMQLPPGTYRLASIAVTPAGGTPALEFVPMPSLSPDGFTGFGSLCPGVDGDNTIKLGTDFMDADGAAYGGAANHPPSLAPLADVSVPEGETMDVALAATDLDGQPLSFALTSGPAYVTVSTVEPGTGTAMGNARVAPGYTDAGSATATVTVTDGTGSDAKSFGITVPDVNRAPTLFQPDDMMPYEGGTLDQLVSATDPEGTALTFYTVVGPPYMTVTTHEPLSARGIIHLAPGFDDAGMMTATLGVTDGHLVDTKDFMIMVRNQDRPPVLTLPDAATVEEGDRMGFEVLATDLDGDHVTLTTGALPPGAAFSDRGTNSGFFFWIPRFDAAGIHAIEFTADDNQGMQATGTVTITVTDATRAVALAQPLDMALAEGEVAEQALYGFDASGDLLSFEKVSGPAYVTVTTQSASPGTAEGLVHAAPGFEDAGTTSARVAATDGTLRDEASFAIVVIDAGAGPKHGEPPFVPPFPVIDVGRTPHTVTMGDLNADGHLDLAVANFDSKSVSVLLGLGDGRFAARTDYMAGMMPHTVAIADLNGDGRLDLATTNMGGNSIGSFLGMGDGRFGMMRAFPMSGSPMILETGDLDHDGDLDLAVSNQSGNTMVVMRGAGDGTFEQIGEYPAGQHPHGLIVGDVNNDGDLDVVMANDVSRTVCVYLGRGDGTFDRAPDFATSAPHYLDAGDWNGDGRLDVGIANLVNGTVSVCLGNGDGTFHEVAELPTGAAAHGVHAVDLDGDGLDDLLVSNQVANTLSVFMGRGDGTFAPKVDIPVNAGAHSIASGDLDGDGDPDVVVSGIVANTEIVLMNRRPPVLPARAFTEGGDRVLRLWAGRPAWTLRVEPVGESFRASDVLPGSLVLVSRGTGSLARIAAVGGKASLASDRDRNGVQELGVSFAVEDLCALFSQVVGRRDLTVTLQGDLVAGGRFRTEVAVVVQGVPGHAKGPGPGRATVAPNPLNPEAVIRFETAREGPVLLRIYDAQGRLVRTLLEAREAAAGPHAVRFDGLDARGARLASGVYFFRVSTPDGVTSGRFAILK